MKNIGLKHYAIILANLLLFIIVFFIAVFALPKPIKIEINNKTALTDSPTVIKASHISMTATVGEVLEKNGVSVEDDYDYTPDASSSVAGINTIVVSKRLPILLVVNGNAQDIQSSAETVGKVLEENGITVGEKDSVVPSIDTKLTDEITEINLTQVLEEVRPEATVAENQPQEQPPAEQSQPEQPNPQQQSTNNGVLALASATSNSLASRNSSGANGIAKTTLNSDGSLDVTSVHSYARPVDSGNPMPSGYTPNDLLVVGQTRLRKAAAEAFEKMSAAMKKDIGVELMAISGYRSTSEQAQLSSLAAGADYSEHQTGLAIDLGIPGCENVSPSDHFEATPAYSWLLNHAAEYGYCLSMPEKTYWVAFEPWHWRFLGSDLAPLVRQAQVSGECIQYTDYYPSHLHVLCKK